MLALLTCENDNGDNQAAVNHHCFPHASSWLCYPTTIVPPGFRATGQCTETSPSFTLIIGCTSSQKICSSKPGEFFPISLRHEQCWRVSPVTAGSP